MIEKKIEPHRQLNDLDGKTWTRYSVSVWDLKKTKKEASLGHPALFPQALIERLVKIFTKSRDIVLDPFMGAGSTLVAAQILDRKGIGFEIAPHYISLAKERLAQISESTLSEVEIYEHDARQLAQEISPDSVDFVVTSPPYWNIHHQRRTANGKAPRPYSTSKQDLGNINDYPTFLDALNTVFEQLQIVVKPGRWCCLIVMDLRKKNRFYPLHLDCIQLMNRSGFLLDDIIIWDRRAEYHNLRPLGYPTTFRVNKVHEYILIFQKPL